MPAAVKSQHEGYIALDGCEQTDRSHKGVVALEMYEVPIAALDRGMDGRCHIEIEILRPRGHPPPAHAAYLCLGRPIPRGVRREHINRVAARHQARAALLDVGLYAAHERVASGGNHQDSHRPISPGSRSGHSSASAFPHCLSWNAVGDERDRSQYPLAQDGLEHAPAVPDGVQVALAADARSLEARYLDDVGMV